MVTCLSKECYRFNGLRPREKESFEGGEKVVTAVNRVRKTNRKVQEGDSKKMRTLQEENLQTLGRTSANKMEMIAEEKKAKSANELQVVI